MKILLLCWRDTGHPEGGGSERYLERVAEHLAEQGHRVVFRTAAYPGAPKKSERAAVRYSRCGGNFSVYVRAWGAMLAARVGLGPIARALGGRPDVVLDTQNGIPFFASVFSGRPTVVLTHHCHREQWPVAGKLVGMVGWFIESSLAPAVQRSCRYITVSRPSADDLQGLGIEGDRISIIRNGVDPVPEVAVDAERTVSQDPCAVDGGPRLVTLSRLVPHKQIEHAIDAIAAINPTYPDAVLDVVGSGWWSDELLAYAEKQGIADRVVFHGQVSEEEKHLILSRACVHVMPSRKEGWGLAVIEAAQHGVPTVGYRSSAGLQDSVVDGVTGLLADTPAGLVESVGSIVGDPDLRAFLGAEAKKRAETFSWDATARAVEQVLSDVAVKR
ncbi:glycosyltransferase family 4 protein [Corynebacterium sp. HMSC11E11]|uniref:glycosyltransferase family 4 protein n=1 Tax=Corynebacterium sp. HMSC11E11 TaxID=1581089 RepID=UPI0008A34398|nr:glycosyltransferase family 4 protein [Corynebacterium sp. HMSC11E11]OFU57515.1 glycosyl transferase [Corynebacterium sp. HMSC11E11]